MTAKSKGNGAANGASKVGAIGNGNGSGHAPSKVTVASAITATTRTSTVLLTLREAIDEARIKGFAGDPCPDCGQFMLVRNGTCLKCVGCGATTGCS